MTMHVCIFTSAHPWDDVRVASKFAESFLASGARVTWIGPDTAFFAQAKDRDARIDYRLVHSQPGWSGRIQRFRTLRQQLQSIPDLDWIYTPDPDAAALALSARTNAKVVFDIHEEYHKGHFVTKLPTPAIKPTERAVQATIAAITGRCDLVTSVNGAILDAYRAPPQRQIVTFNTPPDWFGRTRPADVPAAPAPLTFFHGKSLAGNGTGVLLRALSDRDRTGDTARVIMLPAPGGGMAPYDPEFSERAKGLGVEDQLDLRKAVSHREMPGLMAQANVGLISYNRTLGVGSLPNRFFEYMALGIPILAPEYSTQMRKIIQEEEIGWLADFEDPRSVAQAMRDIADHRDEVTEKGMRARRAFEDKYQWEPTFVRFYSALDAAK